MITSASHKTGIVTDPVRVMVVDDSVVARGLISRWIDEDPELAVVATHRTGEKAVNDITRSDPDVVVLDIEMPDMDGLTALPLILKKKPNVRVVMASTLTLRNAEISLRALSLGASDYIAKPESNRGVSTSSDFRRELLEKVRHLGASAVRRPRPKLAVQSASGVRAAPLVKTAPARLKSVETDTGSAGRSIALKPFSRVLPKVLLIGSSTGGPQALTKLLGEVGAKVHHIPILITQHMPPTFTAILAEHMHKAAGLPAAEAVNGEAVEAGRIYVAPGGKHMTITGTASAPTIRLDDGPQVNFCKPAVDPLFMSASKIYGPAILAVVLTGMGSDGAKGVEVIGDAGGSIIAQDENSSVVWGMPQAAAMTGQCSAVLPIDQIGGKVAQIVRGGRL